MEFAKIAGLLLVVAGIVWMFVAEFWSRRGQARGHGGGVPEMIKTLLDWAAKNLPRKLLPGVFLIVAGIVLFAVG